MNQLRTGRFALLIGTVGVAVIAATFYFSAVAVLCAVFALATVLLGVCGVRTRAGRIGLGIAFIALPGLAFVSHRHNEASNANRLRNAPEVYFSPNGGCTDAIVREIRSAKRSVLVQAYSFTSEPIANALVAAHNRGVDVGVILCKKQLRGDGDYSKAEMLTLNGVRPLIDKERRYAHNKVIVVDREVVITGSFNFSNGAENENAENLLVLRDASLAEKYTNNWNTHSHHSKTYSADLLTGVLNDDL